MKHIRRLIRLVQIHVVLVRHGLDEFILAAHLLRPLRILLYLAPWYWVRGELAPRGVRIRKTLEDLGPIFVKFGQMLSTRRDLLAPDISKELAKLQDSVPPFPGSIARDNIEKLLKQPVTELFAEFSEQPLASASIAQVHAARLHNGQEVIVKVLRPGVAKQIARDIDVLKLIAGLVNRYWTEGHRLRPLEVVDEFERILYDELDLQREAANASQLRRNFESTDLLYVPEVHWPYTRRDVMVMERIYAIQISDIDALKKAGVDFKALSERGVEIFFTQVFRDNFFHADMHPGNIFVSVENPDKPTYIAVDFGIMGTLSPDDKRYLAENFLAFFRRDYHRVAMLHVESGWVPRKTRVEEFESAIRTVCEPIFERPLSEISFGQLLLRLFQTARRFDMEIQPQLMLLQKTLLNIEGLGRDLYPELDLWATAKPFMERWMSEQTGARAFFRGVASEMPHWAERLYELPTLAHEVLHQASNGSLEVRWRNPELDQLREEVRLSSRRSSLSLGGAGIFIGIALLYGLEHVSLPVFLPLAAAGVLFILASLKET
ncbi:MAG: ubiquinone biosynthesis regulatory protein kinase UbiB [Gammaproteobacteria bacterium]|nr:MAG: ubiquinone biosynthesis regulatory protein kinase UbiB [Gammaproteobacteria bacterium]